MNDGNDLRKKNIMGTEKKHHCGHKKKHQFYFSALMSRGAAVAVHQVPHVAVWSGPKVTAKKDVDMHFHALPCTYMHI